jgi:hypothetical protein
MYHCASADTTLQVEQQQLNEQPVLSRLPASMYIQTKTPYPCHRSLTSSRNGLRLRHNSILGLAILLKLGHVKRHDHAVAHNLLWVVQKPF